MNIHKLIRKEHFIRVLEDSLELVRSRRGVDLVICRQQLSAGNMLRIRAVKGIRLQALVAAHLSENAEQLILGNSKDNRNGLELFDDDEIRRVRRNNVAGIDEPQTDPA